MVASKVRKTKKKRVLRKKSKKESKRKSKKVCSVTKVCHFEKVSTPIPVPSGLRLHDWREEKKVKKGKRDKRS
jgi:hypothetical protein